MSSKDKPKILPPVYLLVTLLIMALLHYYWPVARLLYAPLKYMGVVLVICGVVITTVSAGAFFKAKTPVIPFATSTVVVTTGLYRFTRNPMYLGMVLALLGVALLLGSVSTLVPPLVFVVIIHKLFILREEIFLEKLFGAQYLAYKSRVRRWL